MSKILLPMGPAHVEKIFDGTKKYEFRKTICKRDVTELVLYSTGPAKKVVGEVTPKTFWRALQTISGR